MKQSFRSHSAAELRNEENEILRFYKIVKMENYSLFNLMIDGKLLILIFIALNLGTIFIKNRGKFIISNITINILFIFLIIGMTLTQRFLVFIDIEAVEQAFAFPYLVDILYYNSNKFILIGLFLLINLIITYKKLIYNKAKDDNSINLV